ncbi:MAG: DinB family protein [Saonia sp.]
MSTFLFLESIDEEKATYRYADDKWSIKQVVGHITDHERIKISRAFLLSRKEVVQLWGYDQNSLVENSRFEELSFQLLVHDFKNVRKGSVSFLNGLSKSQLKIKGMANEFEVTLYGFLKSIVGHEMHHISIIKERYF